MSATNFDCEPAGSSTVPRSQQKVKRVRYSLSEMRALSELVIQARNSLRNVPDHMTPDKYKQIWVDISNCMHVNGYPKRSWRRLRLKAQRMMNPPTENGSCEQASGNHAVSMLIDHATLSPDYSRMILENSMTTTVTSASSAGDPSNLNSSCGVSARRSPGSSPPSITFNSATVPSPLLSFSETSAENAITLTDSARAFSTSVINSTGVRTTCPQILHVCSKAVTDSAGSTTFCLSKRQQNILTVPMLPTLSNVLSSASVLDAENDNFVINHDRIDLCGSSEEDTDENVTSKSHSSQPNSLERISHSPSTSSNTENSICHTVEVRSPPPPLPPEPIASLTEIDFQKRMEIYNLKLEILKLKRDYWTEKLRAVSGARVPTS